MPHVSRSHFLAQALPWILHHNSRWCNRHTTAERRKKKKGETCKNPKHPPEVTINVYDFFFWVYIQWVRPFYPYHIGHLNSLLTDEMTAGKDVLFAKSCLLTLLYRYVIQLMNSLPTTGNAFFKPLKIATGNTFFCFWYMLMTRGQMQAF